MHKFFIYLALILIVAACTSNKEENINTFQSILSDRSLNASCPYFTEDASGLQYLVFTAENKENETYVYFTSWDNKTGQFKEPEKILNSKGAAISAESMPKAAFKTNGEIIIAFSVKKPTESNPYGGEIRYITSKDKGRNWTEPAFLHEDTVSGKGRSYFDLVRLADGEVGASWLDASYPEGGRPVKFSKTSLNEGFANETLVDSLACECCRTKIIQDQKGDIHVAFRDVNVIKDDLHIRDLLVATSKDGGASFLKAAPLSNDNWELIGCPHSGPGISKTENKLHAAWFTAGGETGIYYTSTENVDNGFSVREMISKKGKNPQVLGISDNQVAILWSELSQNEENLDAGHHHGGHGNKPKMPSDAYFRIMLMIKSGNDTEVIQISEAGKNASFPVLVENNGGFITAWTEETDEKQYIVVKNFTKDVFNKKIK